MPELSYRHEVSNWDTPGEPKVTATAHGFIYRVGILCKRGGTAQRRRREVLMNRG